jgi:hypothetical protein
MKLNVNGVVIQKKHNSIYKGIDGDNWYFNDCEELSERFEKYYYDDIEMSYIDDRYFDCCVNMDYIKQYINESKKRNIEYRLLLCETIKELPLFHLSDEFKIKFLGYDYAYSGSDYYSCIVNDIISNRIKEFKDIKLNENGLFDSEEAVLDFVNFRDIVKQRYPITMFELGNFTVYKLSEIFYIE